MQVIVSRNIKTLLDYGGGGSNWEKPNFDNKSGQSAKEFFKLSSVNTFEPAREKNNKLKSDCVVCMDVLEHIFVTDIPFIIEELFSLTNKLLICNVACYYASALLPNGENAHITVRNPMWWKGIFDYQLINNNIDVILICSTKYNEGYIFGPYNSKKWLKSKKFVIEDTSFKKFEVGAPSKSS
jgi:hypothetical protein